MLRIAFFIGFNITLALPDPLILIFVSAPPNISASEIMRRIKGRSARKLLEIFPELKKRYWGGHFWARGYFCVTSGEVSKEMIKNYIEHHFEPKVSDTFGVDNGYRL